MTVLKKIGFTLALVCLLLVGAVIPATANSETTAATEHYVIFGDSLAIGFEPGMTVGSVPYGYSDRIYEQALLRGRAVMSNYGLGGLNSAGLLALLRAVDETKVIKGSDIQPQLPDPRADQVVSDTAKIKADLAAATLLTVTIGGNDIGTDIVEKLQRLDIADLDPFTEPLLKSYKENVTAALELVFKINPDLRVYIADQYSPVPVIMRAEYPKAQKMKDQLTETLQTIAQSFQSKGFQLHAVPVAEVFVGSEGLYSHIAQRDIHPTQDGYAKIAEQFAKSIWGEYRTDLTKSDPITVVVAGRTVNTVHLPALIENSTFVPLREYAEGLGATVDWDAETSTASIRYAGNDVALTIGSTSIVINGVSKPIDTPPPHAYESAGEMKTYVPLRLMAEGLGFDVQYIQQSRTAYINR